MTAHRAAQPADSQHGVRWEALAEVALMTTSGGPFEEDVFFVLTYDGGSNSAIPLGEAEELLQRLQELPGFDNETFIRAMGSVRKAFRGCGADSLIAAWAAGCLEVARVRPFDGPGVQVETADVRRDFADAGDPDVVMRAHIFDQTVQRLGPGRAP
jgi:hypothetical protein